MLTCFLAALTAAGNQEAQKPYYEYEKLAELIEHQSEEYALIDVRTPEEYAAGYIPTAVNIPVDRIAENPPQISEDTQIILYCRTGVRSARAQNILLDMGFTRITDFGGYTRWEGDLILP